MKNLCSTIQMNINPKRNFIALFFLLLLNFPILSSGQIVSNGLVAYYPFNGNANDESINTNHAVVYGATLTDDLFGNPNSAYYFDGVDDKFQISSVNITNPVTIILLAKFYNLAASTPCQQHKGKLMIAHVKKEKKT